MERFTSAQRRMLFLCFLCYSAAYTGRLNLSASLPGLRAELLLSETQSGLFQTLLALVYATGQIVNGALADRVSARRSIGIGLLLSAACNAAFGLSHRFGLMAALWALNGAAQSMLWTPIVRMTAAWFSGKQRERASFVLSVTGAVRAAGVGAELALFFSGACRRDGGGRRGGASAFAR